MDTTFRPPNALTLPVLDARGGRAILFQSMLLGAALALPVMAHVAGLPVRWLLPMHWPVIFVGLAYGWRSGGAVGALVPVLSHALTGFPVVPMLPALTVELCAYGAIAGLAREVLRMSPLLAVLAAVVLGRVLFAGMVVLTGGTDGATVAYFTVAMAPGIPAAAAQVIALPILAKWWVRREGGGGDAG